MTDLIEPLLRDLLASLGNDGRPYAEVMEAWRTSCPRLPVWEEANDRGLVARARIADTSMVVMTARGQAFLASEPGRG
jgi:hypothetical protein